MENALEGTLMQISAGRPIGHPWIRRKPRGVLQDVLLQGILRNVI
jgi:hypothetical protein